MKKYFLFAIWLLMPTIDLFAQSLPKGLFKFHEVKKFEYLSQKANFVQVSDQSQRNVLINFSDKVVKIWDGNASVFKVVDVQIREKTTSTEAYVYKLKDKRGKNYDLQLVLMKSRLATVPGVRFFYSRDAKGYYNKCLSLM